ncbi:hypothetical protein [Noviherbaspirillum saxi]|uniref:Uncharacterized protein n=1 Tax=Noviherbaspirillum saxi TaxID=2320863 RepID=A0A3A3FZA4_9BURK|nr:hypothetical protein [Noviherbaspirillum saxi]RJF92419.1 hypothetical protein D3871_27775 [Noviherbaspirillum saxi]
MVSLRFFMSMAELRFVARCGLLCLLGSAFCTTVANAANSQTASGSADTAKRSLLPFPSSATIHQPILQKAPVGQIALPPTKPAAPEVPLPTRMAPALALQPEGAIVLIGPVVDVPPPSPPQAAVAAAAPAAVAPRMALVPDAPYKAPVYSD